MSKKTLAFFEDFKNGDACDINIESDKRIIIALIGSTGSGKSTMGQKISELLEITFISIGDLFRKKVTKNDLLGNFLSDCNETFSSRQVPDEIIMGILVDRIKESDCAHGFILDGFPKTASQAEVLKNVILRENDIHIPIFLDVDETTIRNRITKRYICPKCGNQVRESDENSWPGYCPLDAQNGKMVQLVRRAKDIDEKKLEKHFKVFRNNKDKIFSILRSRDSIVTIVNKNKGVEDNFQDIKKEICGKLQRQ